MNVSTEDALSEQIVGALVLNQGRLEVPDALVKAVGQRIHETQDKLPLATVLIAIATRLKDLPASRTATGQVCALAAIALGDVALNGALCKALYARRPAS